MVRFRDNNKISLASIAKSTIKKKCKKNQPSHSRESIKSFSGFLARRPLVLKIETTNLCNANCSFCGYQRMRRKKEILPLDIFEKIIKDYVEMGGEAITLTPCAGEILTDPLLMERLDILARYPSITQISFTTNLIYHDKLSDLDWIRWLNRLNFFQISCGGLDRSTYLRVFRSDQHDKVMIGLHRILSIIKSSGIKNQLALALRTDREDYLRTNRELVMDFNDYFYISHISEYGNWAGRLHGNENTNNISINDECPSKTTPCCGVMKTMLGVLSSGDITACPCCDMDCQFFPLGNIRRQHLAQAYQHPLRLQAMNNPKASPCLKCSMFSSWKIFLNEGWLNSENPCIITDKFYRMFMGG